MEAYPRSALTVTLHYAYNVTLLPFHLHTEGMSSYGTQMLDCCRYIFLSMVITLQYIKNRFEHMYVFVWPNMRHRYHCDRFPHRFVTQLERRCKSQYKPRHMPPSSLHSETRIVLSGWFYLFRE